MGSLPNCDNKRDNRRGKLAIIISKGSVRWFLAGHFGQFLGNFGGLVTWSKSKSVHICMLVHFYHLNFQFEDFD